MTTILDTLQFMQFIGPHNPQALVPGAPNRVAGRGWMIVLEGVWIGFDHDPGSKGDGEFYWVSVASDGAQLFTRTSADAIAGDGVQTGVKEGTWLSTRRFPLYATKEEPPFDHISVGFNLIERDEGSPVAEVIGDFANPAKLLDLVLPGAGTAASGIVSAVQHLIELDQDDESVHANETLFKATDSLRYRFFTLRHKAGHDRNPNVAVFSAIPATSTTGDDFWYSPSDENCTVDLQGCVSAGPGLGGTYKTIKLPPVNKDGRLSLLLKPHAPIVGLGVVVVLKRADGTIVHQDTWVPSANGPWCKESIEVAPGEYRLELAQWLLALPLKVKVDVGAIFSAG